MRHYMWAEAKVVWQKGWLNLLGWKEGRGSVRRAVYTCGLKVWAAVRRSKAWHVRNAWVEAEGEVGRQKGWLNILGCKGGAVGCYWVVATLYQEESYETLYMGGSKSSEAKRLIKHTQLQGRWVGGWNATELKLLFIRHILATLDQTRTSYS